jgi:cytochrome P450
MQRAHARYGDAFTIKVGTEPPWVMLAHPDAVREVFTGDPGVLHAGQANVILRPFLGRASVLLIDGPEHLRQRKLMLPPFHGSRMAGYRDMVAAIAREHIASWPRGERVRLAPRMQAITLEVVLRVIFGFRLPGDPLVPRDRLPRSSRLRRRTRDRRRRDGESPRLDELRGRVRTMVERIMRLRRCSSWSCASCWPSWAARATPPLRTRHPSGRAAARSRSCPRAGRRSS